MSIVSMQKVLIGGMKSDEQAILKDLQRRRVLHVSELPQAGLSTPAVREALSRAEKQAAQAEAALKILSEYAPESGGMFASLSGAKELSFADWQKKEEEREKALALTEILSEKQKQISEGTARAARAQVLAEGLAPWKNLDLPLNMSGTAATSVLIGALPGLWTEEAVRQLLSEQLPDFDAYSLELLSGDASQTPLVLVCLKEEAARAEEVLRKKGFARPIMTSDKTPAEAISDLRFEKAAAISEAEEAKAAIRALADRRDSLQFLYDDCQLEAARLSAFGRAGEGGRSFFLSGYVPAARAQALKKALEEKYTASVELIAPEEDEDAPILLKNNPFSAPTESVVESYGMPGRGEVDPTSIMSVFYYFLFGLMLSDAGYGLLMVIGCAIVLKKFPKMGRSMKQLFTMFFWCGISTFIWGILFGGFFGDAIDVVAHTFFGVPKEVAIFKPLWYAPLEKPMKLLVYSFAFGVAHLFVGLGIKGYQLLKQKRVMDFVGGVLSWFLLLIGLILMLLPSDLFGSIAGSPIPLPPAVQSAAKVLAILGALGLLLFAAWDRKNFGLRLALGLYELYGITGWLSDVLSYSRLLALGLATGVIASVINSMASMFGSGIVGAVLFIVIFLVGHTLNMAINLLGAYVHTNRLQYVEFFGKFFDGGGEAFTPLAADTTKYYHMEEMKQ